MLSWLRRRRRTVAPAAGHLHRSGIVAPAVRTPPRWVGFPLSGLIPAVAVAVLVPANANAATVRVAFESLWFTAAQGEQNQITAHVVHPRSSSRRPGQWTIRDAGAQLKPRRGCVAVDEHTVRCSIESDRAFRVELGDSDDALQFTELRGDRAHTVFLWVDAGPGNDRVTGSPHFAHFHGGRGDDFLEAGGKRVNLQGGRDNDRLYGGAGTDLLIASRGVDYLDGRAGDDRLYNEHWYSSQRNIAPEPDVFVGGDGSDYVSYGRRSAPVVVDLADPNGEAGEAGEGDLLIAVEEVEGGGGNDVLSGDDGPNTFDLGGGDRVTGRGGGDWFFFGSGRPKGDNTTVSCGPGRDHISGFVRVAGLLQPGCEVIDHIIERWKVSAYPVTTPGRRLDYKLRCPTVGIPGSLDPAPCSGVIRLRSAVSGRLLALGRFSRGRWRNHTVTAELTPLGERLAERRNGVKAHTFLRLSARQPYGTQITRWTVRLTMP